LGNQLRDWPVSCFGLLGHAPTHLGSSRLGRFDGLVQKYAASAGLSLGFCMGLGSQLAGTLLRLLSSALLGLLLSLLLIALLNLGLMLSTSKLGLPLHERLLLTRVKQLRLPDRACGPLCVLLLLCLGAGPGDALRHAQVG